MFILVANKFHTHCCLYSVHTRVNLEYDILTVYCDMSNKNTFIKYFISFLKAEKRWNTEQITVSTGCSLNHESFSYNEIKCSSNERLFSLEKHFFVLFSRKLTRDTLFREIQILEILGLISTVLCREMKKLSFLMKETIYSRYVRNLDDFLKSHKIMQFQALFTVVLFFSFFSKKTLLKNFSYRKNRMAETISLVEVSGTVCFFFFIIQQQWKKINIHIGTCPIFCHWQKYCM